MNILEVIEMPIMNLCRYCPSGVFSPPVMTIEILPIWIILHQIQGKKKSIDINVKYFFNKVNIVLLLNITIDKIRC